VPAYLLDTQIVIWASAEPEKLSEVVARLIANPGESMLVSSVSIAEMAIKRSIGKLSLPASPTQICSEMDFAELPLTWAAAEHVEMLPLIHRDPFDRLLIGQAIEYQNVSLMANS
jgi:PIN domain nuclease of toxin-antitoxin system